MIIFRYLTREVLLTTMAVTSVLLLIITSTHLIGYLADAAAGEISTSVVMSLVWNRIPLFLELLLPLGLFLGILLAHGRFYLESEMVVMRACGLSYRRLIGYTLGPALVVSVLVGMVSLYITPAGMWEAKRIIADQRNRTELEMLVPGTFQTSRSNQVTYAREISDEGELIDLFVSGIDPNGETYLLVGKTGEQRFIDEQGRFLVIRDGYRYQGEPGVTRYAELGYAEYGIKLPDPKLTTQITHLDAIPTAELLGSERPDYVSRLHWRLSLPILALVVAVLAVPLAKTSPRQGRYAKLIPSIVIYQIYVGTLTGARSAVEQGDAGAYLIWIVHLMALALAVSFVVFEPFWARVLSLMPSIPKFRKAKAGAS